MSTKEVRLATVLREMPYAIAFSQRVHLFHNLVARDKEDHQGDRVNFLQGKAIHVHIRRNFIYEDAFEKLSSDNGKTSYLLGRRQPIKLIQVVSLLQAFAGTPLFFQNCSLGFLQGLRSTNIK